MFTPLTSQALTESKYVNLLQNLHVMVLQKFLVCCNYGVVAVEIQRQYVFFATLIEWRFPFCIWSFEGTWRLIVVTRRQNHKSNSKKPWIIHFENLCNNWNINFVVFFFVGSIRHNDDSMIFPMHIFVFFLIMPDTKLRLFLFPLWKCIEGCWWIIEFYTFYFEHLLA